MRELSMIVTVKGTKLVPKGFIQPIILIALNNKFPKKFPDGQAKTVFVGADSIKCIRIPKDDDEYERTLERFKDFDSLLETTMEEELENEKSLTWSPRPRLRYKVKKIIRSMKKKTGVTARTLLEKIFGITFYLDERGVEAGFL